MTIKTLKEEKATDLKLSRLAAIQNPLAAAK